MLDLSGRVALVTGTGPNIGETIAATLARAGAAVLCNDLRADQAEIAAGAIRDAGRKAMAVACDIRDPAAVDDMLARAERQFGGPVDTLVNNAAVSLPKGLLATSVDDWDLVTGVVLRGMFVVTKAVVLRLIAVGKGGVVINIASTSGHRGRKNAIAYCTSKGGVLNFTRALATELAPHGIRVCSVSPTKTGDALVGGAAGSRDFGEIPLGRLGQPQDQANAVLFLASDLASFITGEDIRVDGGTLATWGTKSHPDQAAKAGPGG
jgi:NAD(P)-dependent dehydrogenase (short-subunit alcohol dehydrogenase family)